MPWFGPVNNACTCCEPDPCPDCSGLTYLEVAGLTSGGDCSPGCEGANGTYLFSGQVLNIDSQCKKAWFMSGWDCGHTIPPKTEIINVGAGQCNGRTGQPNFVVAMFDMGGGTRKIQVALTLAYTGFTGFAYRRRRYYWVWEGTFADCSPGTGPFFLSLVSESYTSCYEDPDLPIGDYCGWGEAIITVG